MLKNIKYVHYFFILKNIFLEKKIYFILKKMYAYLYSLLSILLFFCIFIFFFKLSLFFVLYNYIFSIFVSYFFLNTWFYFYNIYRYSKYTSAIQRFWKRTYMLFWLIEFFLFAIYIYLYFISPTEPYYFYSSSSVNFLQNQFLSYDNNIYFFILLSCLLSNVCLFCIKNNNIYFFYKIWYLIFIIYNTVLFFEFYKSMCALFPINRICFLDDLMKQNTSYLSTNVNSNSTHSYIFSDDITLYRVFTYFNIITIFLKFWHILFIYIIYIFSTIGFLNKNTPSFDTISIICQNNMYVFLFASLLNIFYLKKILAFFYSDIYFWLKNNSTSNLFYFFNEFRLFFFI